MSINSFLITLAAGVIISFFLFKGCNSLQHEQPKLVAPEKLVKNMVDNKKMVIAKIDSLQNLVNTTSKQVQSFVLSQNKADNTIANLREKIAALLKKPAEEANTGQIDNDLAIVVEKLNKATDTRNTACDSTVATLQGIIVLKDSISVFKDSLYNKIRQSFDTAIDNNLKLIEFSKYQKKEIRRRKAGVILWKAAAIGAGVFMLKKSL